MIIRNSTILIIRVFAILGIIIFAYNAIINGLNLMSIFMLFVACCFYYTFAESAKSRALRYLKAAEKKDANAQYYIGICYITGNGVIKNISEGIKWLHRAAEQGNSNAIAEIKKLGKNVQFNKASEPSEAQAQYELGLSYAKGDGIAKDITEAVKWYRKAAEQGHSKAQNDLGRCYLIGAGVQEDELEAAKWYRKAAEQGDADGQYNLGLCYMRSIGIQNNELVAAKGTESCKSS